MKVEIKENWKTILILQEYRGASRSICNLRSAILREASIIMHYVSNYAFHLIKNLATDLVYLGKNTDKYISVSVSMDKN